MNSYQLLIVTGVASGSIALKPVSLTENASAEEIAKMSMLKTLSVALCCVFALATTATAEDQQLIRLSSVMLKPSEKPGAVAEVVFDNTSTNLPNDDTTFPLDLGAVSISVEFIFNEGGFGSDTIIVNPGELICVPSDCRLNTPEGFVQTIYLYDLEGVGM